MPEKRTNIGGAGGGSSSIANIAGNILRNRSSNPSETASQPRAEGPGQEGHARLRIMRSLGAEAELTLILASSTGEASKVQGRFVRDHPNGIVAELTTALGPGVVLRVEGEIETEGERRTIESRYQVASSEVRGVAKYHVHLNAQTTQDSGAGQGRGEQAKPREGDRRTESQERSEDAAPLRDDAEPCADYYEVLQVSRSADSDTIHRVFHLLAQRYHPDNSATGDEGRFRLLVEAHRVLTDPEKRAGHDVFLNKETRGRVRLFDSLESTQGVQAEVRKREGVLRLLYTRRMTEPENPHMTGRDLVKMLEIPAEHLEFSFWFLRTRGHIIRADNNRFEITWEGVMAFEESQENYALKQPLTLPAPAAVAM